MSKQVILWKTLGTISALNNAFTGVGSGQNWNATEPPGTHPWSAAGEFSNLQITLETAPGVGQSRLFVLRINGVDSALSVTISGTSTVGTSSPGTSVSISQWDTVTMKSDPTGTPVANVDVSFSIDFDSTTPGQQCYGYASGANYAVTRTNRLFFASEGLDASTPEDIASIAGTINGYGALLDTAVLVGTWTLVIFKNGVQQDGSGGTVDTRLVFTVGDPVAKQASFSLSVAAGDLFRFQIQETVNATTVSISWAPLFTASAPGEFMLGASTIANVTAAANLYSRPTGGNATAPSATEAEVQAKVGVTPFILSGFRVLLNGTATAYTFTLRKNTAATALTCTVSGGTSASDLTHKVYCTPGDLIAVEIDPTGAPTTRMAGFSFGARATPVGSWGFIGTNAGMGFAA